MIAFGSVTLVGTICSAVNWAIGTSGPESGRSTMSVEFTPGMFCSAGKPKRGVGGSQRPEDRQIECCSEIDVETFSPLAGEDLPGEPFGAEGMDGGVGQAGVVGRGDRADVARRARQVVPSTVLPDESPAGERVRCRRFQLGPVSDVIGPVLYRKVFGLVLTLVNRNS